MPVVSVGAPLSPLPAAADRVAVIAVRREGRVCCGRGNPACRVMSCHVSGAVPRDPPRGRQRRSPGAVGTTPWRCAVFASYPPPGTLNWESSSLLNVIMRQ